VQRAIVFAGTVFVTDVRNLSIPPLQPKATRAIALSDAWWKAPKCINQWFILPFPSLIEVEFGSAPKANRLRLKGGLSLLQSVMEIRTNAVDVTNQKMSPTTGGISRFEVCYCV